MNNIKDLKSTALLFWPEHIQSSPDSLSLLLNTQESFFDVLSVATAHPQAWREALKSNDQLSLNLFLKHLMVFSDIGGEQIKRFSTEFNRFFPQGEFTFLWRDKIHVYAFKHNPPTWSNTGLNLSEGLIHKRVKESTQIEDLANLIFFAGLATNADSTNIPPVVLEKCVIGSLIGDRVRLEEEAKQKYLHVSKITSGASANSMGQIAQSYVKEFLSNQLGSEWTTTSHIPGISQNLGRTPMSFDTVFISPTRKYFAVEVSFQVTTNSTIERKAGQANSRFAMLHEKGHKIAYVIDGSGNFDRPSAIRTIMENSDCTVNMSDEALSALANFMRFTK